MDTFISEPDVLNKRRFCISGFTVIYSCYFILNFSVINREEIIYNALRKTPPCQKLGQTT